MTTASQEATRRPGLLVLSGFVLSVILSAGYTTWSVAASNASEQRIRQEQQQQGAVVERKLCATFGLLAREQPPAGNPATNPSRAYLQDLHLRLAQVRDDIGCGH